MESILWVPGGRNESHLLPTNISLPTVSKLGTPAGVDQAKLDKVAQMPEVKAAYQRELLATLAYNEQSGRLTADERKEFDSYIEKNAQPMLKDGRTMNQFTGKDPMTPESERAMIESWKSTTPGGPTTMPSETGGYVVDMNNPAEGTHLSDKGKALLKARANYVSASVEFSRTVRWGLENNGLSTDYDNYRNVESTVVRQHEESKGQARNTEVKGGIEVPTTRVAQTRGQDSYLA